MDLVLCVDNLCFLCFWFLLFWFCDLRMFCHRFLPQPWPLSKEFGKLQMRDWKRFPRVSSKTENMTPPAMETRLDNEGNTTVSVCSEGADQIWLSSQFTAPTSSLWKPTLVMLLPNDFDGFLWGVWFLARCPLLQKFFCGSYGIAAIHFLGASFVPYRTSENRCLI